MKILTKRARALTCLWLAVLLLVAAFPLAANAEGYRYANLYMGENALTGEETDIMELINASYYCQIANDEALDEWFSSELELALEGSDLTGWNFWRYSGSSGSIITDSEKIGTYPADVVIDELKEDELNKIDDPAYELFIEPVIEHKYWFTHQPTADEIFVTTNKEAESYQWYEYDYKDLGDKVLQHEDTVTDETKEASTYAWQGNCLGNGKWESTEDSDSGHTMDLGLEITEGDILTVTVNTAEFDGEVYEYPDTDVFTKEGNVYTYVAKADNYFNFWLYGSSVPFEATITLKDKEFCEVGAIAGQNKNAYTGEANKIVSCKASFENGKYVITSDLVEIGDYYIVKHPTTEEPTVAVNKPADVKGYQWYSYKVEEITGTFADNEATDIDPKKEFAIEAYQTQEELDELETSGLSPENADDMIIGAYDSDGWWKSLKFEHGTLFQMFLNVKSGEKFKVEIADPDAQEEIDLADYYIRVSAFNKSEGTNSAQNIIVNKDGYFTVPKGCDMLVFILEEDSGTVFSLRSAVQTGNLRIKLTATREIVETEKVEGQTTDTFTGNEGTYIAKVTMKDDTVLTSAPFNAKAKSTGGNAGGNTNGSSTSGPIPNAGDSTAALAWALIGILCAASMVITLRLRKRTSK